MELALPRVMRPAYVAAALLLLIKAPPLKIPVPRKVKAFVAVITVPFKSKTAPDVMLTAPPFPPKAVAFPILMVPELIVVPPV